MDSSTRREPPKLLTRNFKILFAAHLFFGMSFWPYVLLPVYLQTLGADLLIVGIIMGTASLAGIISRPWVGAALDRVGRKRCLIIGALVFLAANLLYLKVDNLDGLIYIARLLHGLGMGILMVSFFTLAADLSPEKRRMEGIALFGISGHLSGTIGVPLGEAVIRFGGYHALFWNCAVLALLSVFMIFWIRDPGHHEPETPSISFWRLAKEPAIRVPLLATVAFSISLASYMIFIKPYALSMGIGSVTQFFLAYTLSAVGVRLVGGSWPDRFGAKRVLYPSMVSMALGILLLMIQPTLSGLIISGALCGIGHGFIFPILSIMVIGTERKSSRGSLMALFTMLFDIGLLIGAPMLGFIAREGHYAPMFLTAALIQLVALAAFVLSGRMKKREALAY